MDRTYTLETVGKIGEKVRLLGWAKAVRDHGKITFVDLRDRTGLVQCVGEDLPKVSSESVIEVEGTVAERPKDLVNPNLETGKVEIKIDKLTVISKAEELPIPVEGEGLDIDEGIRLKYRYLDLRRSRMAKNLRVRSKTTAFIRSWLVDKDFV